MSDNHKYATETAQWQVKSGFWTLGDLIVRIEDVFENDKDLTSKDAKTQARQIVIPLWNQQLATQQSWPKDEKTIADKLAAAFETLHQNHKIPARMNFTCCRTCGVYEIGLDLEGEKPVGYAFFHEQTTAGFTQYPGTPIMIYYGLFEGSESTSLDVANTVVQVLTEAGLSVEWNGDAKKAIQVSCEGWRKRLIEQESDSSYHNDEDEEGRQEE
ncbi:hypothetical protein EMPG_10081 [Blastomyces silverae]|uniref:DUF6891 domain-containing protein n=1 Tax=Blastomyces silverae TaxID=2060906 RepID=A0A0H1B607_9EURO|nr:hypothetical protein EMPG_10081 [Blastomyces silverae]